MIVLSVIDSTRYY